MSVCLEPGLLSDHIQRDLCKTGASFPCALTASLRKLQRRWSTYGTEGRYNRSRNQKSQWCKDLQIHLRRRKDSASFTAILEFSSPPWIWSPSSLAVGAGNVLIPDSSRGSDSSPPPGNALW